MISHSDSSRARPSLRPPRAHSFMKAAPTPIFHPRKQFHRSYLSTRFSIIIIIIIAVMIKSQNISSRFGFPSKWRRGGGARESGTRQSIAKRAARCPVGAWLPPPSLDGVACGPAEAGWFDITTHIVCVTH